MLLWSVLYRVATASRLRSAKNCHWFYVRFNSRFNCGCCVPHSCGKEFWEGESAGLASCCPGSWRRRRSRWRRSCSSWWRRRSSVCRRRRRRSQCLKFFHSSSYFQHLAKILLQQYRNYAAATFTTFFAAVFGSDSNAIISKWVCIVVELNFNEIHPKVWRCWLPLLSEAGAALPPRVEIKAAADLLLLLLLPFIFLLPLVFTQTSSICRLCSILCSNQAIVELLNNKIDIAVQKQQSIKAGRITIASALHCGAEGHSTAGLGDQ